MVKRNTETDITDLNQPAVIGYFEGKSGDGTITNENGLDIGVDVWKTVFESEEFKSHLENGFYIGFLGHPEDPGCQDFEHACIVLREAYIDDNGEVYSRCDLINTPVGRIVKTFIDAGVHFGLSVRGAGTITGSAVEPDDFVFRGFDVVAFPAYKDAIPDFHEIAASSDIEQRRKYRKICSSITNELPNIDDTGTLKVVQNQFSSNSGMYNDIQTRIDELSCVPCLEYSIEQQKLDGLMNLYLDALATIQDLTAQIEEAVSMCKEKDRRLTASTKIYTDQLNKINSEYKNKITSEKDIERKKYNSVINSNKLLQNENTRLAKNISVLEIKNRKLEVKCNTLESQNSLLSSKNNKLASENSILSSKSAKLTTENNKLNSENNRISTKNNRLSSDNNKLSSENDILTSKNNKLLSENNILNSENNKLASENNRLSNKNNRLNSENNKLSQENDKILASNEVIKNSLNKIKQNNLKYKYKIDSSDSDLKHKDSVIASLNTKIQETVNDRRGLEDDLSNLDDENQELKSDVKAALDLVADYQNAYAELYASIVGVDPNGIVVDTMTSVDELKQSIMNSTSTSNISINPDFTNLDLLDSEQENEYLYNEYEDVYDK